MKLLQELFDILHHSAAAVGLNTGAEIEAALAERPVFTIRFVRPGGADTPATPAVVDAIEQTPRGRSSPTLGRWIDTLRRPRT